MFSGVPLGTQIAWLSSNNTGIPLDVTRVAAVTQLAVTQGDGEPETLNGQPVTVKGAGMVTMGWPPTNTFGLGEVGWACPPCAHITVAPTCNKNPGILMN